MENLRRLETLDLRRNAITSVPKTDWFENADIQFQTVFFSNNPLKELTELMNFGNVQIYVEEDSKYDVLRDKFSMRHTDTEMISLFPVLNNEK